MVQESNSIAEGVINSPLNIIKLARNGFPKSSADLLSKSIGLSDKEMAKIMHVSERTFHRYNANTTFDTNSSEKLLQLASLYSKGEKVFDSLENFKIWMRQGHVLFETKSPLELLDTNTGFRMVEDEIGRIEHGVYI